MTGELTVHPRPRIIDTATGQVGEVLSIRHGEGVTVMFCRGWVDDIGRDELNSGRYEMFGPVAS